MGLIYTSHNSTGVKLSHTSPKNNRRACLCSDGSTYSRDCCNQQVINQGIGSIGPVAPEYRGAFNHEFSQEFD